MMKEGISWAKVWGDLSASVLLTVTPERAPWNGFAGKVSCWRVDWLTLNR